MPDTVLTISPIVSRESLLFRSLREKGIEQLQQKAAITWTDHNVHDPGITLLEALCYVITEPGNQLGFSFKDLIATPSGIANANIDYPSAATNLPCKAVTITDFRKIILDLPEIRNAFFETTTESKIPVFYDKDQKLTYDSGLALAPLLWGGLYSIQLEMEDDDLNANTFSQKLTVVIPPGPATKDIDVIFSFKYWDEVTADWFRANTITSIALEDTIVPLDDTQYEDYYSEWTVTFSDGVVTDFPVWIKLVIPLAPADPIIPNLLAAITTALSSIAPTSPFIKYKANLVAVQGIVDKAHSIFNANRNLGEDLSLFTAIRLQEIAMNALVEITPVADPVEVFAQIIFAIETFFSPRPHFRSLDDLLSDDDFKVEDVFLGPLLDSGFLSEKGLNTLSKGNTIYVSDLVHLILDVQDTSMVRDISLTTYFNNFQAIIDERNCLKIKKGYKPQLSATRTTLVLTRKGVAVAIDQTLVDVRLAVLRANAAAGAAPGPKDLDIPLGELPASLGNYRSVQYELPIVYGTGSAGISVSSTSERIAQLKQLQGYLFLFDQLLANTFAQLANLGDLFAVHQQQSKTYYSQELYNVPGAEDLLGYLGGPDPWEVFIAEKNTYTDLLDQAGEPGDTFFQRRNIILDYLLARTSENRQDYAAMLSTSPGNFSKQIILHDKERFLERYPVLSMARAQAYNYSLLKSIGTPDVWDSTNIGGYAKMVCAKLGFIDKERTLFHPISENFDLFNPPGTRKYRLKDNGGIEVMVSQNTFPGDPEATDSIKTFLQLGRYRENYEISQLSATSFSFKLVFGNVNIAYSGAAILANVAAAENVIQTVITIINEKYLLEGIHVVEHILLRPRHDTGVLSDKLFATLSVDDSTLTDPYSHVVTVVLPSAMQRDFSVAASEQVPAVTGDRLRDPEFLLILQQTILREAPAHLLINIFFLNIDTDPAEALFDDRSSLQNFERKLKTWRETTADLAATDAAKIDAQTKLVTVIEKIYGV